MVPRNQILRLDRSGLDLEADDILLFVGLVILDLHVQMVVDDVLLRLLVIEANWDAISVGHLELSCKWIPKHDCAGEAVQVQIVAEVVLYEILELELFLECVPFGAWDCRVFVDSEGELN
jgi:hypothetical protein